MRWEDSVEPHRRPAAGDDGPGRRRRVAAGSHGGGRGAASPAGRGTWRGAGRRRRGDARGRGQAPAPDARPAVRRATGPASRRSGPRRRSSSSTWRPSSTTTSSTRLRCAAGAPRWSRGPAASGRWRSATCSSRAPSPSWAATAASARSSCCLGASVALALGELAQRRDAFDISISAERYLERCGLKTARLFECACLIGRAGKGGELAANSAEPDLSLERALETFGREIGLAFQLLDDVLDVTGPPERTGKARGTDLLDGTVTLPLILAREEDRSLAKVDLRALDAEGAEEVCDRVAATGALESVRADARGRVETAKRALVTSGPSPGAATAARAGRRRRRRALLVATPEHSPTATTPQPPRGAFSAPGADFAPLDVWDAARSPRGGSGRR